MHRCPLMRQLITDMIVCVHCGFVATTSVPMTTKPAMLSPLGFTIDIDCTGNVLTAALLTSTWGCDTNRIVLISNACPKQSYILIR